MFMSITCSYSPNYNVRFFFSSEFKWLQLVAGNRFLHYDSIGEAGVLDEDDKLISRSGMGRLYKMS